MGKEHRWSFRMALRAPLYEVATLVRMEAEITFSRGEKTDTSSEELLEVVLEELDKAVVKIKDLDAEEFEELVDYFGARREIDEAFGKAMLGEEEPPSDKLS